MTGVSYKGNALTNNQYTVSSGKITLKPSASDNLYLRTPGTGNVVITATGYNDSTVSQTINAGTLASLEVTTQPVPGSASGDTFATQPVVKLKDQYGNDCTTGVSATANVVASAKALLLVEKTEEQGAKALLGQYADAEAVSDWAKESIEMVLTKNIIQGDNQNLRPLESLTRAEAVKVIMKMLESLDLI